MPRIINNNNNNNNGYSVLGPVWQEPEPSRVTGLNSMSQENKYRLLIINSRNMTCGRQAKELPFVPVGLCTSFLL
jgi:hypothetical protein